MGLREGPLNRCGEGWPSVRTRRDRDHLRDAYGSWVRDDAPSLDAQIMLIVLAAAVGYLLVPTTWTLGNTLLAPYRQRDEARAQLRELRPDSPTLAKEFSDWVTPKRAALPQFGMRQQAGLSRGVA